MERMSRAALALLLGVVLVVAGGAAAQAQEDPHAGTTAIVVRAFVCPVEYGGTDYAGDCDPEADIAVDVTLDASEFGVSGETGEDGAVGFQGLGEGAYTITLGVPGDFADFITFCGAEGETEPRTIRGANTNQIGVDLGPEDVLTCSFYIIPVDARGEPAPTPGQGPELPDTGVLGTQSGDHADAALVLLLLLAFAMTVTGVLLMSGRSWTGNTRRHDAG